MSRGLLRSTAVFSAMTMLSRLAGFARDVIQAHLFGAGGIVDAFAIAYRIPNYLRRIFAEGSFASAFVPVLSELRQKGDEAALKDFLDHVAGALCAVVLVVSGLGMLAAPLVVAAIAPGTLDDPEKFALTSDLLRIVFPYLALVSMTALAGSVLNSFQKFALPAVTPVLHNLAVIAAMLWLAPQMQRPIFALAWGVLAAGAFQLVLLWPAMGRLGLRPRLRIDLRHEGVRRVGRLMLPTLFSSSVAQLNLIVGTVFASLLVDGSQSWLYYSDRLIEFPLGVFGVALGTVILPHLSRRHADTDAAGYAAALDWGLRTVLLLAVPAALGLALLAAPLTITIFERGHFDAVDSTMTGLSLMAMSIGIPGFMASKVLLSAFYARQDTRTPMRAAVWTVLINVALTAALTTPLWLGGIPGAHAGIAAATGLAGLANAWLLWRALRRAGDFRLAAGWGRHLLRVAAASLALAIAVLAIDHVIGDWRAWSGAARWGLLCATIAAGAGAYGLALLATGWRLRDLRGLDPREQPGWHNRASMSRLFRDVEGDSPCPQGSVVCIGAFDGLHRGHQALIGRVRERARAAGLASAAVSFEPLPREFFAPADPPTRLSLPRAKFEGLRDLGIDVVALLRFDAAMAAMSPAAFVDAVLVRRLAAREVWVGPEFRFGHRRQGDLALLQALGAAHGFVAHAVDTVADDGARVSASAIRAALAAGDLASAEAALGRRYAIAGKVVHGRQLGRRLGYPTANLRLAGKRAPLGGIFAVWVHGVGAAPRAGVASLGTRPTVYGVEPLLEAHLFDFDGDLYGSRIGIEFVAKLRDEEKFDDLPSLVRQMDLDAQQARRTLRHDTEQRGATA